MSAPVASGGNTARMPVESEDAAESLEPVRVGQAPENLFAVKFGHEKNHDLARERNHPLE